MDKQDTFEVLKGNIKSINLNDLIKQHKDAFVDWTTSYYIEENKARVLRSLNQTYVKFTKYNATASEEPTWKAGQKRKMSKIWKNKQHTIRRLCEIQRELLDLAWGDDWCNDYETTIITKKVERQIEEPA